MFVCLYWEVECLYAGACQFISIFCLFLPLPSMPVVHADMGSSMLFSSWISKWFNLWVPGSCAAVCCVCSAITCWFWYTLSVYWLKTWPWAAYIQMPKNGETFCMWPQSAEFHWVVEWFGLEGTLKLKSMMEMLKDKCKYTQIYNSRMCAYPDEQSCNGLMHRIISWYSVW